MQKIVAIATNMASQINSSVSDYIANFSPEKYLSSRQLGESSTPYNTALSIALAKLLHDVLCEHAPGEQLVDVGSGPSVRHVLSASAKYRHITLSDPVPGNRRVLEQYMTAAADSSLDHWWTENFKLTAKLEGDAQKWQDVRDRIRACMKEVLWCDILQEQPLGSEHCGELYDCVTSTLCLEAACKDVASYKQAVKNLVSLAKPGAPVVLCGMLKGTCYIVGDSTFSDLHLTSDIVRQSLEAAGCAVTKLHRGSVSLPPSHTAAEEAKEVFIAEARKQSSSQDIAE